MEKRNFRAHGMKSDEKPFSVKFMRFFGEQMVRMIESLTGIFSLLLKGFEDFS